MTTPRRVAAVLLALATASGCSSTPTVKPTVTPAGPAGVQAPGQEAVQAFNVGLAALQVGDFERADAELRKVTTLAPDEPAAWANLALLALRRKDQSAAQQAIDRALELDPEWSPGAYLAGAVAMAAGDADAAIEHLRQAAASEPPIPAAGHLLAQALDKAVRPAAESAAVRVALADAAPLNSAASLAAARAAAAAGDQVAAARAASRFAELASSWPEHVVPLAGQLAQAAQAGELATVVRQADVLLTAAQSVPAYRNDLRDLEPSPGEIAYPAGVPATLPEASDKPAPPDQATTFDASMLGETAGGPAWAGLSFSAPNGAPEVVVVDREGVRFPARTSPATDPLKVAFPGATGEEGALGPSPLVASDLDGDFALDLAMAGSGGLALYRTTAEGGLQDVTAQSALPPDFLSRPYRGVWAADLEADGDLDLVLAPADGPPVAARNNGDGSFAPAAPFEGAQSAADMVWADLDGDALPEAVFLGDDGTIAIHGNARGGAFKQVTGPELPELAAIAVADTGDRAGLSLVGLGRDGHLYRVRDSRGGDWTADPAPFWEVSTIGSWPNAEAAGSPYRLTPADLDNNGAVDLIASGKQTGQVWLSDGAALTPLALGIPLGGVSAAADLTGDGRLDLVAVDRSGEVRQYAGRGGREYQWKVIRPRASAEAGDGRVNSFGLGGQVELRSGRLVQLAPIASPLVHFGLGTNEAVEVARVVWPNGSIQAEFDLPKDESDSEPIAFEQRLEGSCPYVFAVGPDGPEFIADFLWRSPLGMRINAQSTAGIETTADWIRIPGGAFTSSDGAHQVRITADLWESHFIDAVHLLAIDHPAGSEAWVDERFSIPAPPLTVTLTTPPQALTATDDLGNDATALVADIDGMYLDSFGRGRLQGVTRDHYVELDLGKVARSSGELVLIGRGWTQPTDSSLNVALSQGSDDPPSGLRLEAVSGEGEFRTVAANLGFPAGKNKTVLLNVDDLLGARVRPTTLRLGTNLEIYWDKLSWAQLWPGPGPRVQELATTTAALRYRGFSARRAAGPTSPELPEYEVLAGTLQRRRDLEGFYTRFGDVSELLADTDDRTAIMNAGDELVLTFEAGAPPPSGWVRDFVLAGDGWVKDGNHNTLHSRTVLPMPAHGQDYSAVAPGALLDDAVVRAHASDWTTYHTRFVGTEPVREALHRSIP